MDFRKFAKPPKKVASAEKVLGVVKKTKKPKKSKKDKKTKTKKGKPKGKPKGDAKSLLSKELKRAPTTDQSIEDNTRTQFLKDLHGRIGNTDGRTNGLWNSYKRNITAQSFGGSPYEMYRLREESDILREQLERATNDGRRLPQMSTNATQTETQTSPTPPTPPTPTPQSTTPTTLAIRTPLDRGLRPSLLGFGQSMPATRPPVARAEPPMPAKPGFVPFSGKSNTLRSGAMGDHIDYNISGAPPRTNGGDAGIEYDFDDLESVSTMSGDDEMDDTHGITNRERREVESWYERTYPGDFEDDGEETKSDTLYDF